VGMFWTIWCLNSSFSFKGVALVLSDGHLCHDYEPESGPPCWTFSSEGSTHAQANLKSKFSYV
jgi:hypothetical protein